jgi:hypothetical protein
MTLPKEHLEDEIWSLIRMSPEKLPLETYKCSSFLSAFEASKKRSSKCDSVNRKAKMIPLATPRVQKLNRKLNKFENKFRINSKNLIPIVLKKQILTTTGTLKSHAYWEKKKHQWPLNIAQQP